MLDRKSLYSATQPAAVANTMLIKPGSTGQGWFFFTVALLAALIGGLLGGVLLANTQAGICQKSVYYADSWMCRSVPKPVVMTVEAEPVIVYVDSNAKAEVEAADVAANNSWAMIRKHGLNAELLKPVAMEIAAITIFQALGIRLLRHSKNIISRVLPRMMKGRVMPSLMKGMRAPSLKKIMYHITKIYKKTHASKVVTRTKKYLKHFQHIKHMDEHEHHHDDHHHAVDGEHQVATTTTTCDKRDDRHAVAIVNPLSQRKYFLE